MSLLSACPHPTGGPESESADRLTSEKKSHRDFNGFKGAVKKGARRKNSKAVWKQKANWGEKSEQETWRKGWLSDRAVKVNRFLYRKHGDLISSVSQGSDMPLPLLSPSQCFPYVCLLHLWTQVIIIVPRLQIWNSHACWNRFYNTKIIMRGLFSQWQTCSGTGERFAWPEANTPCWDWARWCSSSLLSQAAKERPHFAHLWVLLVVPLLIVYDLQAQCRSAV